MFKPLMLATALLLAGTTFAGTLLLRRCRTRWIPTTLR